MAIYIQIGAGVGDLDYSANYRDGFSALIKAMRLKEKDRVLVVEANPLNIPTLKRSWSNFPQTEVYNFAIVTPKINLAGKVQFFYAVDDGPFFQIASLDENHVRKYCPNSEIRSMSTVAIDINTFLAEKCRNEPIEILALDIEGLDLEVLDSLDLVRFRIHKISFEKNVDQQMKKIIEAKLRLFGYRRAGSGMDPHNSDELWVFPINRREGAMVFFRNVTHKLWEIQIPYRHSLKMLIRRKRNK